MTTLWSEQTAILWIASAAQNFVEEKLPEKTGKIPSSNQDMETTFLLTF
jgi:hypothetical protein